MKPGHNDIDGNEDVSSSDGLAVGQTHKNQRLLNLYDRNLGQES